jgi:hypothetical protein
VRDVLVYEVGDEGRRGDADGLGLAGTERNDNLPCHYACRHGGTGR